MTNSSEKDSKKSEAKSLQKNSLKDLIADGIKKIKESLSYADGKVDGHEKVRSVFPPSQEYEQDSEKSKAYKKGVEIVAGYDVGLNEHMHTDYSVMDGISSAGAMTETSARRGFGGVTVTDHGEMGGVLPASAEGKNWSIFRHPEKGAVRTGRKFSSFKELTKYAKTNGFYDAAETKGAGSDSSASAREGHSHNHDGPCIACFRPSSTEARVYDVFDANSLIEVSKFKVFSGSELYVSWESEKNEHYHHITAVATGQHGHEILTMLTSLGAIPSRRYVNKALYRPRIYVEDIGIAMKEAKGELVITTGCPLSITSQALRKGDVAKAEKFFQWAMENVPKGNFFAELHLCDVSRDFNRLYPKAEDAYYSRLFGTYIARFRKAREEGESLEKAGKSLAERYAQDLRHFVLASGEMGYFKKVDASQIMDSMTQDKNPNRILGEEHKNSYQGEVANVFQSAFKKLGIDFNPRSLGDQAFHDARRIEREVESHVGEILDSVASGETAVLDEDSLDLLAYAKEILEGVPQEKRDPDFVGEKGYFSFERFIARFVIFILCKTATKDNLGILSGRDVVGKILDTMSRSSLLTRDSAQALSVVTKENMLGLDKIVRGTLPQETFHGYVKAIYQTLRALENPESKVSALVKKSQTGEEIVEDVVLGPHGGLEDEITEEFYTSPEGNWMEPVNKELIKLARKYDVPLILATDSHMTYESLFDVQTALIRRGKRRAWSMSRPYFIPRSTLNGFLADSDGLSFVQKEILKVGDIIEAFGGGNLLLNKAKCASTFKWDTAVPKIRPSSLETYDEAKLLLDSGKVREFLPRPLSQEEKDSGLKEHEFAFPDKNINIATALILAAYNRAHKKGMHPDTEEYRERIRRELHLLQVADGGDFAEYFLVLQKAIQDWRAAGVSVGPGRGSGGGMLTAYVCEICQQDPIVHGFSDSRWMNADRKKGTQPDIDVDVSDRQVAGVCLAKIAKESFEDSVAENPLSPLESLLVNGIFYASEKIDHKTALKEEKAHLDSYKVSNRSDPAAAQTDTEEAETKPHGHEGAISNNAGDIQDPVLAEELFYERIQQAQNMMSGKGRGFTIDEDSETPDFDSADALALDSSSNVVYGVPIVRVGTHQSLKAKAAIKEAIRMSDDTPFGSLPSFVQASGEWLDKNRNRVEGLGEEDINCLYEEDMFSHMPLKERMTKRRIRLADKITADIAQCAGLPRGYKNEKDYFFGGVYGEVPDYWDTGNMPPSGSAYAARYFDQQHERAKSNGKTSVKELVLSMLNIQKAPGVHAGGFLIGREILRRVPLRADNNGFVGQLHMGECETVGILKFDVLGLSNLNYISDTLRLIIQTHSYDKLSWWLKDKDAYDQVRSGKSPDILWRFVPKSTLRAAEVLANRRAMIFQVDTNVVARELDKFDASEVFKRIKECPYDEKDPRNFVLTDFLSAVLALFRPGPMKMGEHIKYLERFRGAKYELIHPWLGPFLNTTYGIIAYQEQVMAITKAGGGFSDAQTDNIRRAMGKKKISALEAIEKDGVKGAANIFITGCVTKHGVDEDSAAKIWELIEPFAEYGFNIAHSYHYGIISAMTLFLKAYYEKEFFRVVMGISDPKDSARFLKEIAAHTQSPCALNSDRTFWEIEKNEYASEDADENAKESAWYFPGLSSVEKIQHSMIDRILSVRDGLTKEQVRSLKPQEFFERLGELSKSQARLLASSGLLRNLGTAEEIADGYERALVETILPQKDREKKRKELAKREEISLDKASGGESE